MAGSGWTRKSLQTMKLLHRAAATRQKPAVFFSNSSIFSTTIIEDCLQRHDGLIMDGVLQALTAGLEG